MTKPLVVAREDFIDNLVNLINESHLPMFIIRDVLESIKKEVDESAGKEFMTAKEQYEKSLSEESSKQEE